VSAETDEEFLARIEGMVAEAKKAAFNGRMVVARADQRRLGILAAGVGYAEHAYLGTMGSDHALYQVECARGRAVRLVVERLRS
jgi:hypothetical protein